MRTIVFISLMFVFVASHACAKEIYLDCKVTYDKIIGEFPDAQVGMSRNWKIDIDLDNKEGKWGGWTDDTFFEESTDVNRKLSINDKNVFFGDAVGAKDLFVVKRDTLDAFGFLKSDTNGMVTFSGKCERVDKR